MSNWRIIEGNCLVEMPKFADLSVDHVITDSPYSEHVHGKSRAGAREMRDKDEWKACISRAVDLGFAAIKPEEMRAAAFQFGRLARRWVLAFSDLESTGDWRECLTGYDDSPLDYVRTGLWIKLNATPQFTGDRPAVGAEAINICHRTGRKVWNGGGTHAVWYAEPDETVALAVPIEINRSHNRPRLHTTQKPLELARQLVRLFTDEGDTILDPYCGSGTFGEACVIEGRNYIGIDIDPHNVRVSRARLSRASGIYAEMPKRRNTKEITTPLFVDADLSQEAAI